MGSCVTDDTIYNYPGSVVVEKSTSPTNPSAGSYTYYVKLRVEDKSRLLSKYFIEIVQIPKFEYDQVELGDTIK